MDERKKKTPVNIDISAKAAVSGEVPSSVMGRLGNSLADAVSPFTEGMGLIGDNIRAHREDLATQRLQGAYRKVIEQNLAISPTPLKFLVPYLEAVSIQDEGDITLNKMWENLLVSAATDFHSEHSVFIQILKDLTPQAAKLFADIFMQSDRKKISRSFESDVRTVQRHIELNLSRMLRYGKNSVEFRVFYGSMNDVVEEVTPVISSARDLVSSNINFSVHEQDSSGATQKSANPDSDFHTKELLILERQNLVKVHVLEFDLVSLKKLPQTEVNFYALLRIQMACLTEIGSELLKACAPDDY